MAGAAVYALIASPAFAQPGDKIVVTGDVELIETGPNADIAVGGDTGDIYAGNNTVIEAENVTLECPDGGDCKGEDGKDGVAGKDGDMGRRGIRGPQGRTGPQGPAGRDGLDGAVDYGGISGALALGRIEQPRKNGFVIGVGAGHYGGRSALAIGVGKAWERLSVDLGAFIEEGSENEMGVAGSINYHFD